MLTINANPETVLMKIGQREFAEEGDADYWNMLKGNIYNGQLHNYKEALNCYNNIKYNFNPIQLSQNMEKCYYMAGDIENAMLQAQALDYLSAENRLMSLQLNQGKLAPIINNLTTEIELSEYLEPSVQDYNLLGKCYLLNKDYQHAATTLAEALKINENSPEALLYYGTALKALGRDSLANQYLEKTLNATYQENTPCEEEIQSQANIMLGRTDEARKQLEALEQNWNEKIMEQLPGYAIDSKTTCYEIAAIYAMLGDSGKTLEWMTKHFEYDVMPYNFGYMALDNRFDKVKDVPGLRTLVEKYYFQWKNNK